MAKYLKDCGFALMLFAITISICEGNGMGTGAVGFGFYILGSVFSE